MYKPIILKKSYNSVCKAVFSTEHNYCAMSISCYTRGTRTSQTNDNVTSVTRIEDGLVVICNVTLRKSRESRSTDLRGFSRGGFSRFPGPPPRLAHMLCQFSINRISVIDSWFSVCWTNMYLLIVRRGSERIKRWERRWERKGIVCKCGRNFTLSRSLGFRGKGCLSSSRVRNRASTGVPFTFADINGFQPIRAKWNG